MSAQARSGGRGLVGGLRRAGLAAVLMLVALALPDAGPSSTQAVLVRTETAAAVPLDRDIVWILAVGSDARPGEDMTRVRGDALQLIGLHTRTGAATAIGIPRDSYVTIPGVGSDRINAAMVYGGPDLLGRAVGDLIGIEPQYVFVTRFPFFEQMISDIGGITVRNPRAFSDSNLKERGFEAGRLRLGGYDAMAFARIRKSLPGGDFDRSANQQIVLRGIQAEIAAKADTPGFIEKGVLSVLRHLHTDLGPSELFRIAQAIAQVDPRKITGCVLRGGFATINGASVVTPYRDDARRYGDDARRDAVISRC
ncbi:LCP family protein [Nocardioides sp. R-C-SC26]|uniref:LCP family protein n=1 Tax=Nocardioides sp. R-C-SC26 TaxID=2870414 RepID=UPI001E3A1EB8|nr:LCP family protein [Nocardioides sp. R-C-SC26]